MSDFLDEKVPRVPPMSRAAIEALAFEFSRQVAPETLVAPCALDMYQLTEFRLPKVGIHFSSASVAELPVQHAGTSSAGSGAIEVLVREEIWEDLIGSGRRCNFARSTGCHELGHVVLHVPYFRKVRGLNAAVGMLNRLERRELKAYEDPEWQAWEFARAILMPKSAMRFVAGRPVSHIADIFNVSEALVHKRLQTLGLR